MTKFGSEIFIVDRTLKKNTLRFSMPRTLYYLWYYNSYIQCNSVRKWKKIHL